MKRITIIGIIVILLFSWVTVVSADDTSVYVSPSNYTVSTSDTFTVDITCNPDQPVKAFEFNLYFNPSLLQANYVIEGDFFSGYSTFFNDGTINNPAGQINDVFGLIMGQGNVTDSGSLVSISFSAKQSTGTSTLNLNNVGITDEEGYITVNVSDGSVTVQDSGGGGSGGGGNPLPPPPQPPNTPPEEPDIPIGPNYVELGVEYQYSAVTIDADEDLIKYMFDWGDGNFSNWSPYTVSNVSVNLSYSWSDISTYEIKVIAQDDNGENSSWSLPLNITVSQSDVEGEPPVADIQVPENITVNATVDFDASGSYDEDGFIVSYNWDFGDGQKGNGVSPTHVYQKPGEYTVTLSVTDNNGNTFNASIIVSVASLFDEGLSDGNVLFPVHLGFVAIACVIAVVATMIALYRDIIKSFIATHHGVSMHSGKHTQNRINKIDAKIRKLKK